MQYQLPMGIKIFLQRSVQVQISLQILYKSLPLGASELCFAASYKYKSWSCKQDQDLYL